MKLVDTSSKSTNPISCLAVLFGGSRGRRPRCDDGGRVVVEEVVDLQIIE